MGIYETRKEEKYSRFRTRGTRKKRAEKITHVEHNRREKKNYNGIP